MNKYELLKRIKKIIIENDVPISKISHIDISEQLQSTYRDYSRKTKNSFRKSVFETIQKLAADISPNLIIQPAENNTKSQITSDINGSMNQLLLKRYKNENSPIVCDEPQNENFYIDTNGNKNTSDKRKISEEINNDKRGLSKKLKHDEDGVNIKPKAKLFNLITPSEISFTDLEGIEETVKDLDENFLNWVRNNSDMLSPRGLILHGPSGCGKFTFVKAMASNLSMGLISISADELLPNLSSEMDQKLKLLLDQAISEQPCLICVNRIELIASTRDDIHPNVNDIKMLTQFLQFIETLSGRQLRVWVIGITSKIELINPMLLMPGKLDEEIVIKMPDHSVRMRILKKFCLIYENLINNKSEIFDNQEIDNLMDTSMETIKVDKYLDFEELSQCTPAYSGADLKKLVIKAFRHAILRQLEIPTKEICLDDFMAVIKKMQPTAKKEDYVTVPNVTWKDVGALDDIREELKISILIPVRQPDLMNSLGLNNPSGVLLFGPPGCGKTMIAKAIANEASINFISVKGPELLNMYVGESERNIRTLFRRAQDCSPCIVFFDEIDSICEKRSATSDKGNNVKVVQQLLAELDGLQERRDLYIVGATNRLDRVDPAFLRENRFNRILYVGLPGGNERFEILQAITKNGTSPLVDTDVNLKSIADDPRCSKFTGADLTSLVRTAARFLLKDLLCIDNAVSTSTTGVPNMFKNDEQLNLESDCDLQPCNSPPFKRNNIPGITMHHFELAMQKVKPSIRQKDLEYYEKIAREYDLEDDSRTN